MKQINSLRIGRLKAIEIGTILEGTVITKRKQELYVDLSPFGVGRLYGKFYLESKDIAQKLKPGDKIGVQIVGLNDGYGNYEIILKEVSDLDKWQKFINLYRDNQILEVEIKDANRGGWIVEVDGITGFIPLSQLSPEYYPRVTGNNKDLILNHLKKFIGQRVKCRITSVDPKQNKVILSEKAAKEEEYNRVLSKLMVGDVLEVKVVGLSPFGIFVRFNDDPPMDGLIHLSEIPEEQAANLEEHFKVGDVLKAKLIQIKNDKVSFSLRNLIVDPWVVFTKKYKENDIVYGILKEKNDIFGVVEVENVQGLIFENLEKIEIGQGYNFIIEKLNSKEKTLVLKLA